MHKTRAELNQARKGELAIHLLDSLNLQQEFTLPSEAANGASDLMMTLTGPAWGAYASGGKVGFGPSVVVIRVDTRTVAPNSDNIPI